MDPNLPQSKSVPSNLTASRRHRVSISGSGSFQSHLSSLGHYRVRSASEHDSLSFACPEKDYLLTLEDGLAEQKPRGRPCLPKQSVTDPTAFLVDDVRKILNGHIWRLRTLFTLYCCLSVLFFTIKTHVFFWELFQVAQPQNPQSPALIPHIAQEADGHSTPLAPLMDVSLSQRLSIAFRGLSPQAHLETFVVQAHPGRKSDITVCLWIEDTQVGDTLVSATLWPGPVSLLLVTTNAPNSTEYKNLLSYLSTKHTSTNTSIHVLYVPSVTGASSNAYLNMARFFAPTSRVILFPDSMPNPAISTRNARWVDKLPANTRHPVLLGNMTHKGFSPRPLAPVVLPRDHAVWCPERLYMFGSRTLDWEDCLWKLWLESAGGASSMTVPHIWDASKNATEISVPPFAVKMRLRWSTRYRSEACAFALKRSRALEPLLKTEKKHMQWRKKFCRESDLRQRKVLEYAQHVTYQRFHRVSVE